MYGYGCFFLRWMYWWIHFLGLMEGSITTWEIYSLTVQEAWGLIARFQADWVPLKVINMCVCVCVRTSKFPLRNYHSYLIKGFTLPQHEFFLINDICNDLLSKQVHVLHYQAEIRPWVSNGLCGLSCMFETYFNIFTCMLSGRL